MGVQFQFLCDAFTAATGVSVWWGVRETEKRHFEAAPDSAPLPCRKAVAQIWPSPCQEGYGALMVDALAVLDGLGRCGSTHYARRQLAVSARGPRHITSRLLRMRRTKPRRMLRKSSLAGAVKCDVVRSESAGFHHVAAGEQRISLMPAMLSVGDGESSHQHRPLWEEDVVMPGP